MAFFRSKSALVSKKVCHKVFYVKTISDKVLKHSLPYLSVQNGWWGRPIVLKFRPNMTQKRRISVGFRL